MSKGSRFTPVYEKAVGGGNKEGKNFRCLSSRRRRKKKAGRKVKRNPFETK